MMSGTVDDSNGMELLPLSDLGASSVNLKKSSGGMQLQSFNFQHGCLFWTHLQFSCLFLLFLLGHRYDTCLFLLLLLRHMYDTCLFEPSLLALYAYRIIFLAFLILVFIYGVYFRNSWMVNWMCFFDGKYLYGSWSGAWLDNAKFNITLFCFQLALAKRSMLLLLRFGSYIVIMWSNFQIWIFVLGNNNPGSKK